MHKSNRDNIGCLQFAFVVPGAAFLFAESAQVHGIGDHLDAVQGGKDQRDDDHQRVLEAVCPTDVLRVISNPRACCAWLIS